MNEAKEAKWPIQPTFLSLRNGKNEDTADFNNDGVYYPDYIRGFLADLSHDDNVQNTLSMFQVVPGDFNAKDKDISENISKKSSISENRTVLENDQIDPRIKKMIDGKKIIRIDSGTFGFNEACTAFRKCNKNAIKQCYIQDSRTGIFAHPSFKEIKKYPSMEYTNNLENIINEFNKEEKCDSTHLKLTEYDNNYSYVHYTCRMSFLQETMFPVYAQGRFVACLMLGQMQIETFNSNDAFNNCPFEIQCDRDLSLCKEVRSKLNQKNISKQTWEDRVNTIIKRIRIFQKRLEIRIDHRNNTYITESFIDIRRKFIEETKDIKIRDNNIAFKFYKALKISFTLFRDKFYSKKCDFIRMFALPMNEESKKYILVGCSTSNCDTETDYISLRKKYFFTVQKGQDLTKISKKDYSKEEISRIVSSMGSVDFQDEYDKHDFLSFKKLIADNFALIIWERGIVEDNKKCKNFVEAINSFYSMVSQIYAHIRGSFLQYMLDTMISETTHETANFTLPALSIMEKKIDYVPYKLIPKEWLPEINKGFIEFQHHKNNVIEQIRHLNLLLSRPSIIFMDLELYKENVKLFDLLKKMTKLMSSRANDKYQHIDYVQKGAIEIYLDKLYFDHAIFNLIDNAIKHGYFSTNIYIHAELIRTYTNQEILTVKVINYGKEVEKGERIYQLFERGNDQTKGMGLGLFVVEKICSAFGGEVKHGSEPLSEINIPALSYFKKSSKGVELLQMVDEVIKEKILSEVKNLSDDIINEVVYNVDFITTADQFPDSINSPTFRNTFLIEIPINK